MATPDACEEALCAAIESGKLEGPLADDPEVAEVFVAYQKLESLFGLLRQPGTVVAQDTVLSQPTQIGRFLIRRVLGRGAFGTVYLADDPELRRQVAIKVSRRDRFSSADDAERFLEEARSTAGLKHPGIVTVHDVGRENNLCWIVLEYVEGTTLEEEMAAKRLPPPRAAEIVAEVADALHHAHKRGFYHRDLKPGNILLDGRGKPHVADFGLAVSEKSQRLQAGQVAGTPAYMSPEQVRGETDRLNGRTDIWSLGVIFYELLTGRQPFWRGDVQECFDGVLNRDPRPPRQIDDAVSVEYERICLKALSKNPAERQTTARDMAQELRRALRPRKSRLPLIISSAVGVMLVLAAVSAAVLRLGNDGRSQNDEVTTPRPVPERSDDGQRPSGSTEKPTGSTLAVLEFDNHSQDPRLASLGLGLQSMLTTDLRQARGLRIVERARINDILAELDLAKSPYVDPDTAAKIGRLLGASTALVGSYTVSGDQLRMDARLVSVETGEVKLAQKALGARDEVFSLETELAEKIVAQLDASFDESTGRALRNRRADFEAFRLYSEALIAREQGHSSEAEKQLRLALARDADFELARRELRSLEAEALTTLSELEKQKLASAAEIGKALEEHRNRHERVVEQQRYDAQYYASLVILSSHAGLIGSHDKEWRLLARYWHEFAQHVPANEAMEVFGDIKRLVEEEGQFFQDQVDNGVYGPAATSTYEKAWLESSLRDKLSWPMYSAIWPFEEELRVKFGNLSDRQFAEHVGSGYFERSLPRYPNQYLKHVIDLSGGVADVHNLTPPDHVEITRLRLSVVRYYAGLQELPKELQEELRFNYVEPLLHDLEKSGPEEWPDDFATEAILTLRLLAQTGPDTGDKARAANLLLQFVRHAELISSEPATAEGSESTADASRFGKPTFFSIELGGPQVVFVLSIPEPLVLRARILKEVQLELGNVIRAMPSSFRFNVIVTGRLEAKEPVAAFSGLRDADREAKMTAIEFCKQTFYSGYEEHPLGRTVESLLAEWPISDQGHGEVCIVALTQNEEYADVDPEVFESLARMSSDRCPRFHVISTKPVPALGGLAAASGGTGMLVELRIGPSMDVEFKPWDISAFNRAGSSPKPE